MRIPLMVGFCCYISKLAAGLIGQLAKANSFSVQAEFKPPLNNIGQWLTKLRSERTQVE